MTTPVKWFHSGMAGAPVLDGSAGALIAVLDACLVNGCNLVVLDSLVVAGGILTGTKAGHGFVVDQVIRTAGASQSVLNGEWRITSADSNTFSAAASGIADVVGSGALSAKAAPASWEKAFAGTNTAAYRSLAPEATALYMRIDDSNADINAARVIGFESMTDIDTGTGAFPTGAQVSGGSYWRKSQGGSATARPWLVVADGAAFYIVRDSFGTGAYTLDAFGDFLSYKAGDSYNCLLTGMVALSENAPSSALGWSNGTTPNNARAWIVRSYSQIGSAVVASSAGLHGWNQAHVTSGDAGHVLSYPSPVDNGLVLLDAYLMQGNDGISNVLRGLLPGLLFLPQSQPMSHLDRISNISGLDGRTAIIAASYTHPSVIGRVAFDITGPWR